MNDLLQRIFYKRVSAKQNRNFNLQLLKSDEEHRQLLKNGFVHFKGIFTENEVNQLLGIYKHMNGDVSFEKTDYYVNSVSFKSRDLKKITRESVTEIVKPALHRFLKDERLRFPISVGYCINPALSTSGSRPHQDPNLVDENRSYSLVLWISLSNTTVENGCLHVLKGSHLWGNHLRSNFHVKWKFDNYVDDILWKNMTPVQTGIGDVICFDPALIHGSTPNRTNEERLAIQISTIPKDQNLITVIEERKGIFDYAKSFNIDEDYFTEENVCNSPSDKYPVIKEEKINYYYTKEDILELINKSDC